MRQWLNVCAYEERISHIHEKHRHIFIFITFRVSNVRIQKSMVNFGVTSKHATKLFNETKQFPRKMGNTEAKRVNVAGAWVFKWNANQHRNSHLMLWHNFVYYICEFQACRTELVCLMCIFAVVKKKKKNKFSFHNLLNAWTCFPYHKLFYSYLIDI